MKQKSLTITLFTLCILGLAISLTESSLYAGNGKGVSEFTVNIPESGTYSIYVEVHHAKGTVYIQRIKVEKQEDSNGLNIGN